VKGIGVEVRGKLVHEVGGEREGDVGGIEEEERIRGRRHRRKGGRRRR
jgi:hypothetical protein